MNIYLPQTFILGGFVRCETRSLLKVGVHFSHVISTTLLCARKQHGIRSRYFVMGFRNLVSGMKKFDFV